MSRRCWTTRSASRSGPDCTARRWPKTLYGVLELDPKTFRPEMLAGIRRACLRVLHPDRPLMSRDVADDMRVLVEVAFDVLSDERLRHAYNRLLVRGRGELSAQSTYTAAATSIRERVTTKAARLNMCNRQ